MVLLFSLFFASLIVGTFANTYRPTLNGNYAKVNDTSHPPVIVPKKCKDQETTILIGWLRGLYGGEWGYMYFVPNGPNDYLLKWKKDIPGDDYENKGLFWAYQYSGYPGWINFRAQHVHGPNGMWVAVHKSGRFPVQAKEFVDQADGLKTGFMLKIDGVDMDSETRLEYGSQFKLGRGNYFLEIGRDEQVHLIGDSYLDGDFFRMDSTLQQSKSITIPKTNAIGIVAANDYNIESEEHEESDECEVEESNSRMTREKF